MKPIKRVIELFLFLVILGQLALLFQHKSVASDHAMNKVNMQNVQQMAGVTQIIPSEMPLMDLPQTAYQQAQTISNPRKLKALAEAEAGKMMVSGDIGAYKKQLEQSSFFKTH
jgi:hypothetical protein